MKVRNKQDFWSGVMFVILGLGFAWQAGNYQMGTAARMGPGYFPYWLGICLAALGAVVALGALSPKAEVTHVEKFNFKTLGIIVVSVILFGVLLRPLGLYVSLFLLVVGSSIASHDFSWKVALANALFLVIFCYLAFIKGLRLVFPLWPTFLGMH